MRAYKGLTKAELVKACAEMSVERSKRNNAKAGKKEESEDLKDWTYLYKSYPITSKYLFCLANLYDELCEEVKA